LSDIAVSSVVRLDHPPRGERVACHGDGLAGWASSRKTGRMQRIRSLRELAGRYDAVLCDVWGVVHDGRELFPGVVEVLRELRAQGVVVVLLTNGPRPASAITPELEQLGMPRDAWDAIVTSGDAIRVELARRSPGPMVLIGRDTDTALWEGLGLERSDVRRARFAAVAGLRTAQETPAAYAEILREVRGRDLELVCANPDVRVQLGDRLQWAAGAVAQEYARLGGRVVQAGKPHAAIYQRSREAVERIDRRPVPTSRILAIGDGITTDILGANRSGIDSVFIGTGMHGSSLLTNGYLDMARAEDALRAAGAVATYAMTRLA
jgi:HAD superfamily hydrolase (TIGR01459 family)